MSFKALFRSDSGKMVVPTNRMSPMRTLGPSSIMNLRRTLLGGTSSSSVRTVPRGLPFCSSSSSQGAFRRPGLGGLIHRVHRNADFALLEMVQDVGLGEGFGAHVLDFTDQGLLLDHEGNDFPGVAVHGSDLDLSNHFASL